MHGIIVMADHQCMAMKKEKETCRAALGEGWLAGGGCCFWPDMYRCPPPTPQHGPTGLPASTFAAAVPGPLPPTRAPRQPAGRSQRKRELMAMNSNSRTQLTLLCQLSCVWGGKGAEWLSLHSLQAPAGATKPWQQGCAHIGSPPRLAPLHEYLGLG